MNNNEKTVESIRAALAVHCQNVDVKLEEINKITRLFNDQEEFFTVSIGVSYTCDKCDERHERGLNVACVRRGDDFAMLDTEEIFEREEKEEEAGEASAIAVGVSSRLFNAMKKMLQDIAEKKSDG